MWDRLFGLFVLQNTNLRQEQVAFRKQYTFQKKSNSISGRLGKSFIQCFFFYGKLTGASQKIDKSPVPRIYKELMEKELPPWHVHSQRVYKATFD